LKTIPVPGTLASFAGDIRVGTDGVIGVLLGLGEELGVEVGVAPA
jgi:hypothetical protein